MDAMDVIFCSEISQILILNPNPAVLSAHNYLFCQVLLFHMGMSF